MFNAQRYMHMNDTYFAPSTIRFPYELKKVFDRILHELQYPESTSLYIGLGPVGYSSIERVVATPFPLSM